MWSGVVDKTRLLLPAAAFGPGCASSLSGLAALLASCEIEGWRAPAGRQSGSSKRSGTLPGARRGCLFARILPFGS
jgi:hypothetical protein